MKLEDLKQYNPVTIQCHDNPDGDAIAAGFGLFTYFKSLGRDTRLIYSGRNRIQKTNLKLMVEKLEIPIAFVEREEEALMQGLLITVDCQYGASNVTRLVAETVAVIDHHQVEMTDITLSRINPNLGCCATLVWQMLTEENFDISDNIRLGTAFYYGLYSDTNQFAEIYNPLDMDMRDSVPCNKSLIMLFRNSNLSLQELEVAGIAMLRYIFNDDYQYAIIKSQPCDPNILGLISDFLLQVAEIRTCVVYNETDDGYKLSVRSCIKEVQANELAAFLCEGIGSGGGHLEKAGGFISRRLYEDQYPTLHSEAYLSQKMNEYFDNCEIIYAQEYQMDTVNMPAYRKKQVPIGFVRAEEVLPVGTPITIRTLEGDIDMMVEKDLYIMIGIKGEVYPSKRSKFEKSYRVLDKVYGSRECCLQTEYTPTVKNRMDGTSMVLTNHAGVCVTTGETYIYAKPISKRTKVFTAWDEEKYMLGKPGDYLVVRCDDAHDIYVVERDIFDITYERIEDPLGSADES